MKPRLQDKLALITGAGSGIGEAAARAMAHSGAHVCVTDLDGERAEAVAAALRSAGHDALGLAHDVTREDQWEHVVGAMVQRFGGIDVLVNNAGLGATSRLLDTSLEQWRRVFAVNMDGVFLGTRAAVAAMCSGSRHGSVINVSSVMGLVGKADGSAYSASKGAVRLFTKSIAVEVATGGWPIRVNSVHPGYIATPFLLAGLDQRAGETGMPAEAQRMQIEARHPLGRLGLPEDVAHGIVYLASDESAFITGAELVIDGGYTAW